LTIDQAAIDEVFPYNPLREVAFEIRFPMNLRVMPGVWKVQEELESEYPQLQREETQLLNTVASTSYVFTNPEQGRAARVGEDRFAIIFTQYENFEAFSSEIIKRAQRFCEMFSVERFTRVGLRYVNNIPISSEASDGGVVQLSRYVQPYIDLTRTQSHVTQLNQFGLEVILQRDSCLLGVRSALLKNPQSSLEKVYVIDFDASVEEESKPEKLPELLQELHHHIQLEFLSHITEEYKQLMRGQK